MIAFWKYDLYPYMLGGKYTEVKKDLVYVPSYQGWYKPTLVLDDERGKRLLETLKSLEKRYKEESKDLLETYKKKCDDEIAFLLRTPVSVPKED